MILAFEDRPNSPEDFDNLVYAEIPDQEQYPQLYETISKSMIYGSCGYLNPNSSCMVNGKCSKNYPRDFVEQIKINKYEYSLYRRKNNEKTIKKGNVIIDNRWIVSYNPYLSQKYNYHINVKICSSIRSIKYLYKYVYKGHDCVIVSIRDE